MSAQKRRLKDDSSGQKKSKKAKIPAKSAKERKEDATSTLPVSALTLEEVDFPRGGGTSLTPLEVKTIQAEAYREVNEEISKVCIVL
jgi:rRNA biogenesis protein RRP5